MKSSVVCLAALLIALTAGCGGGGGASSASSNSGATLVSSMPNSAPMCDMSMSDMMMGDDMSMSDMSMCDMNLQSAPAPAEPFVVASKALTASANGNAYTATYGDTTNASTSLFNGQMANSSAIALTVVENGTMVSTNISTAYYLTSPYSPLGLAGTSNGAGFKFVFSSVTPYPAMLMVGASGQLDTGTYYTPGTNVAIGSLTETYSVQENDSMTVLLTVSDSGVLNGAPLAQTTVYTVDAAGNLTLSYVQVTLNGVALNFS